MKMKVFDEVLGREEKIHETVTPENGKNIELKEIEPQIPFEEAMESMKEEMRGEVDGM